MQLVGQFGMPAQRLDGVRQIDGARIRDRLAAVQNLDQRQFVLMLFQEVGKAQQNLFAITRGHLAPGTCLKGTAGRSNSTIHILDIPGRDLGDDLAVGWVDGREGAARCGRHIFAVNERASLQF